MADFRAVASVSDVQAGSCTVIQIEGRRPIALFNVDGTFYALDNECLHSGGPLGEGTLEGCIVTCPWHQWQFDVRDGNFLGLHVGGKVPGYECKVEGESVLVKLV